MPVLAFCNKEIRITKLDNLCYNFNMNAVMHIVLDLEGWHHAIPFTHLLELLCYRGGANTMKRYNIFVILWAIYNSKRTKTPEDIEQINITNNRVKNDKLFPCPSRFLSPVLSHRRTHSTDTHSRTQAETRTETCRQRCPANLSIK